MAQIAGFLQLNRCPHCNIAEPSLKVAERFNTADHAGLSMRYWGVYICSTCGGVVTAFSYDQGGHAVEFYPTSRQVDDSIPSKAKSFLEQAVSSYHAPSGAIMLAASAVDSMLKNKGYTKGNLYPRIKQAAEDHLITEGMEQWAHQVRLDANDERHADESAPLPTTEDAKRTVEFALALAEFLFVLPDKVTKGLESSSPASENSHS